MGDRRYSTLTRLGMGALTFNSALAVYNSWGDASSVGFVLTADAALGLLFLCLRDFERPGRGRDTKTKAAVWALTTLLTAMFASRVAPIMPPLASALVWSMAGPYSADVPRLAQAGLTVLTMTGATAVYRTAQDAGSVAFAIGGYVALLLLFRALSAYERAHAHPGAERRRKGLRRKVWCLCTLLTAMFAWKVAGVMPWPLTVAVWAVAADAAVAGFFALCLHHGA
jgi:hypothetical protein